RRRVASERAAAAPELRRVDPVEPQVRGALGPLARGADDGGGNRERLHLVAPLAHVCGGQGRDAVPDFASPLIGETLECPTGVLAATDGHRDGEADGRRCSREEEARPELLGPDRHEGSKPLRYGGFHTGASPLNFK